ncbi:MGMT family protein [Salinisphaera sp. T31B1]|uniref:MGMT family protein n=1 Tax=Salinisphaera sp. T31B1 TaxID=727963 RepID=UPI00333F3AF1
MSEPSSHQAIFEIVAAIPYGRVTTYGQIARLAGLAGQARLVGYALHRCPPGLPWHRVINARGQISLPCESTSALTQRRRLIEEGVRFSGQRVDLSVYGWDGVPA